MLWLVLALALVQTQPQTPRARIDAAVKAGDMKAALRSYDDYVKNLGHPDLPALGVIATAMLRATAGERADASPQSVPALERLARNGDTAALDRLKALAKGAQGFTAPELAPIAALSRLGDAAAQAQLAARLDAAPWSQRVAVIQAIEAAHAAAAGERVAAYLRDAEAGVRSAAARAVGTLGYAKAIPQLEQMLRDDVGAVKLFAAVGLARLGQHGGDAYLASMLSGSVPEIRLIVAGAYENAAPGPWLEQVKPLLADSNPQARVQAARIVACCDRAAAKRVLVDALSSSTPALRAEAADALEGKGLMDARLARTLLADPSPAIFVPAAGAVLTEARAAR